MLTIHNPTQGHVPKNSGPIGLAVLTFIKYTNILTDKQRIYINIDANPYCIIILGQNAWG